MNNLTPEQKDLILNFYFRCGEPSEIDSARDLIASNSQAAELYANLESSLKQLDSIKYEPCPDNLAELTIARLKDAASSDTVAALDAQTDINELLAVEHHKQAVANSIDIKPHFTLWRFAEIGAIAAMILVLVNAMFPVFSNMRNKAYKIACATNLKSIAGGLANYQNSNDGKMPYVTMGQNAPWWKVGNQDQENKSNTRHYWLLVKGDYADASLFVCPGRKGSVAVDLAAGDYDKYCDFPSRDNVSYSFRLTSEEIASRKASQVFSIIMADRNPIFENISTRFDQELFGKIELNDKLLRKMSTNHNKLGQNVLVSGGDASFKDRRVILNDDIYTLRNKRSYLGNERPTTMDDTFLVP